MLLERVCVFRAGILELLDMAGTFVGIRTALGGLGPDSEWTTFCPGDLRRAVDGRMAGGRDDLCSLSYTRRILD